MQFQKGTYNAIPTLTENLEVHPKPFHYWKGLVSERLYKESNNIKQGDPSTVKEHTALLLAVNWCLIWNVGTRFSDKTLSWEWDRSQEMLIANTPWLGYRLQPSRQNNVNLCWENQGWKGWRSIPWDGSKMAKMLDCGMLFTFVWVTGGRISTLNRCVAQTCGLTISFAPLLAIAFRWSLSCSPKSSSPSSLEYSSSWCLRQILMSPLRSNSAQYTISPCWGPSLSALYFLCKNYRAKRVRFAP